MAFVVLLMLSLLPAVALACTGEQSYIVSMKMSFTPNVNPAIPTAEKARLPIIVAVSHSKNFRLFEPKELVDDAVAEVASTYNDDKIVNKFEEHRRQGNVSSWYILKDVPINDVSQLQLTAKDDATLFSVMAPLSPSPAWFVGVDSHDVCQKGELVEEQPGIVVRNYNSGLESGTDFQSDSDRLDKDKRRGIEQVVILEDNTLAVMFVERGKLGVNWWKILLGVLVAVAVVVVLVVCVYPRCRKKKQTDIPLTTQEGVEW